MRSAAKIYILVTLALALLAMPDPASARTTSAADDFASSKPITNKEMHHQRGGFFNVNGVLLSFGYTASTSINGVIQNTINLTDANLAQAAAAGKNLQITNVVNNTQIVTQQQLTLTVNGANFNGHALSLATAFASIRAVH